MRDEEFGLAFLEKYQDRLLFGTDMANCEMTFPLGNWWMSRNTQEDSAGVPMKKSAVQMQKNYFTYKKKEG